MKRLLVNLVLVLCPIAALAVVGNDSFLQPDEAFKLNMQRQGDSNLLVTFEAAPHHYLYRDHLTIDRIIHNAQSGANSDIPSKGKLSTRIKT